MQFVPLAEKMRQLDDFTNDSSIWYEYEEQAPIIIEGYQNRTTVKVSFLSHFILVLLVNNLREIIYFFRITCSIFDVKQKLLYNIEPLDLLFISIQNIKSVKLLKLSISDLYILPWSVHLEKNFNIGERQS